MNRQSGFTLIEIIVTLIIVGIMAVIAGVGISSAVQGYIFAKKNMILAGKAQVALGRMQREVSELCNIPSPNSNAKSTAITIEKINETVTFGQNESQIRLKRDTLGSNPNFVQGDVLTDQVVPNGLQIAYKKGAAAWNASDNINLLSQVVITLTMNGSGIDKNFTFTTAVTPRNNGNTGGVSPPNSSTAPPRYCFVATAAFGDPYHPMVILLKQFRDHYLMKWPGGKFIIHLYYEKGPSLAAMIQDKPWACALSRFLLLPFVVFSFICVYAKGAIPLLILMIISTVVLFNRYAGRSKNMKKTILIQKENGSILLGLIITMVIMAFLGAALVSLTASSNLSNVYNVMQQKAFFLAESGFRYAGSQYANVEDNENNGHNENQNDKANDLNLRHLSMPEGDVLLTLVPFNYVASSSASVGDTSLPVTFVGTAPTCPDSCFAIPSTGKLLITTQTRPNSSSNYTKYADVYSYSFSGSTFTLTPGLVHAVPKWTSITVLGVPPSNQTITPNPDTTETTNRLILNNPNASSAAFFMPKRNGRFSVRGSGTAYRYAYRIDNNDSTTTLYGITNGDDPASTTSFSVTPASLISPKDFFTVYSQSTISGDVQRTLKFIVPVDAISLEGGGPKINSTDTFTEGQGPGATGSHWYSPVHGTYDVPASVGDGGKTDGTSGMAALSLNSSYNYASWGKYFSLLALKWNADYANFWATWFANGKTLSYDAQVKVKYNNQDYYMSGMNFRMKLNVTQTSVKDTSWLGVAFIRGNTAFFETDGMYAGVLPIDDTPLILLWKKDTGDQLSNMTWIAYKRLDSLDFTNGTSVNNGDTYYIQGKTSGARAHVKVEGSNGTTGSFIPYSGWWGNKGIYGRFQPGEDLAKLNEKGILDVSVYVTTPAPAASRVYFGTGCFNAVMQNDVIVGASSGASAKVTNVNKQNGSWNSFLCFDPARGYLDITDTKGTFVNLERLIVFRPSATKIATFDFSLSDVLEPNSWEQLNPWSMMVLRLEEKLAASAPFQNSYVNDIKIYLSDTQGRTSPVMPTGSPLDMYRYASKRWSETPAAGDVQWPTEAGWSTSSASSTCCSAEIQSRDYFTLVRNWVFNTDSDISTHYKLTGTTEEPYSIVRTDQFSTHGMTTFDQNELGLWTSGNNSAKNVFFDDFAVQLEEARSVVGFTTPLME